MDHLNDAPSELIRLGWHDRVAALWNAADSGDLVVGRVVRTSRRFTYVGTEHGLLPAMARLDLDPAPVAGDWVGVAVGELEGSEQVELVLGRWSQLSRRDPSGSATEQVLAANIDTVFIVCGLDRPLKAGRIERSLVLAWDSGATPVVVLTKTDAVDDPSSQVDGVLEVAGDAEVIAVSALSGDGIDALRSHLSSERTVVLLGESGAGKSTLVNRLAGTDVQRTAEVRGSDAKGRHTTVTRDLIVLPCGGVVIDTPGLRSLGLLDASEGLAAAFDEIEALAGACRFRDCAHAAEPGCAVRAAVEKGEIDAERYQRYRGMHDELAGAADDSEDARRQQRRRDDRVGSKARREHERTLGDERTRGDED